MDRELKKKKRLVYVEKKKASQKIQAKFKASQNAREIIK